MTDTPLPTPAALPAAPLAPKIDDGVRYVTYAGEQQLPLIVGLIEKELSEPYRCGS